MKFLQQICLALTCLHAVAQPVPGDTRTNSRNKDVVVVTGVRFAYPLLQRWIDEYNKVKPEVQIIIESRGINDPLAYDILAEAHTHDEDFAKQREYLHVARYAILPVATAGSTFAREYAEKGLNEVLIKQLFFDDLFADKSKHKNIGAPYHIYTRLQKAGSPSVFAEYFGQEQKNIKGEAIAGSDIHLLKATLRDSIGVTYLPLSLVYDTTTRHPVKGLTVLPVDIDGNKKISDDEKFYNNLDDVLQQLETSERKEIRNIPIKSVHLSVDRTRVRAEVIDFIKWVEKNGPAHLHDFGYLQPDASRPTFDTLASKQKP